MWSANSRFFRLRRFGDRRFSLSRRARSVSVTGQRRLRRYDAAAYDPAHAASHSTAQRDRLIG